MDATVMPRAMRYTTPALALVPSGGLTPEELRLIDAYWRAANYLSVGQLYLYDNPLLRVPLTMAHVKPLVVGHWGTVPGLNFIYATVGDLVPLALRAVRKGGRVVCAGIHMSDIPSFPYSLLWEERQVLSVANLTRQDGIEFLALAPRIGIVVKTTVYPLAQANQALADLRAGRFDGAAVLVP